jgi:hypothetical protein
MPRRQTCVFCRKPCESTRDHVPPKGLFPEPRPNNLITVPACGECNSGAHQDDEFMQRLALIDRAARNADARQVAEKAGRALNKPEKQGMRSAFFNTLDFTQLFSEAPVAVSRPVLMAVDGKRLRRIVEKITKGMLWEMTRRKLKARGERGFSEADVPRLPADYRALVHEVGARPDIQDLRYNEQYILRLPEATIGTETFAYRHVIDGDDPFLSLWRFSFYNSVHFMGYTFQGDGTNGVLVARPA